MNSDFSFIVEVDGVFWGRIFPYRKDEEISSLLAKSYPRYGDTRRLALLKFANSQFTLAHDYINTPSDFLVSISSNELFEIS